MCCVQARILLVGSDTIFPVRVITVVGSGFLALRIMPSTFFQNSCLSSMKQSVSLLVLKAIRATYSLWSASRRSLSASFVL